MTLSSNKTDTKGEENKIVLKAKFIDNKKQLFFYQISGDDYWKNIFKQQKQEYIETKENGDIIYNVPWYFGKECSVCEDDFSKKLFLNINEHNEAASVCDSLGADYWSTLAQKSSDINWLSRSKRK